MADTNIVTWVLGDQRYTVDLFDIDGVEWRDAKRASGMTQNQLVYLAVEQADLEAIAAILWIWRRREDPKLEYLAVLKGLNFRLLQDPGAGEEDGGTPDPPA